MKLLRRIGRKHVGPAALTLIIVFAVSTFAGAAEIKIPSAQEFAGVTIRIGDEPKPIMDAIKPLQQEFERQTGIKVEIELMDDNLMIQKFLISSLAGDAYFDAFYGSPKFQEDVIGGGFIRSLDDYCEKYDFPWDDYPSSTLTEMCTYPNTDGKIWGLPYMTMVMSIFYRKDLFEDPKEMTDFQAKYGYSLHPPANPQQWIDVAEFFNRQDEGLFGDTGVAGGTRIWDNLFWVLTSHNDPEWYHYNEGTFEVTYDTPRTVDGWMWLKRVMNNYMPPEIQTWGFGQQMPMFKEGKAAMTRYWTVFANDLLTSTVNPDIEIGIAKPYGRSNIGGGSYMVSSQSENPEAAFLWGLFLQTKDVQREWFRGGAIPTRMSMRTDPQLLAESPAWGTIAPVYAWALDNAAKSRPRINEFVMIQKGQYLRFIEYLDDDTPWEDRALAQKYVTSMHDEIQKLFEDSGRYDS